MPTLLPPPFSSFALMLSTAVAASAMAAVFSMAAVASGTPSFTSMAVPDHEDSYNIPILHAFPQYDSWKDMVMDIVARDASRLQHLASLTTAARPRRSFVPIAPGRRLLHIPNYVVRARLGSPPQRLLAAFDNSNDASWFPCSACAGCSSSSRSFDASQSPSYRSLPCGAPQCSQVPNPSCSVTSSCAFNMTYGAGSSIRAELAQDTLALASNAVRAFTFGCLEKITGTSSPPQGLLGFGRGPLSFVSQTKSLYGSTFSYCLPSFTSFNFSGTLRLGRAGQPVRIKTTPLLLNPRRPSLYYVNMTGIRVGRRVVAVPPAALAFHPATGGGTIVDAGTMFTRLVAQAYAAVRDEFRRRVRSAAPGPLTSLGGFDTCYDGPIRPPTVTFMFSGNVNVTLPVENMLIHSTAGTTTCLAMAAAPAEGVNAGLNVIANFQQQNHRVVFDVANSRVGFARERCSA